MSGHNGHETAEASESPVEGAAPTPQVEAWAEGWVAFHTGTALLKNPFLKGTAEKKEWSKGWLSAAAEEAGYESEE